MSASLEQGLPYSGMGRWVGKCGEMEGMGTGASALDQMETSGASAGQAHPHGHNQTVHAGAEHKQEHQAVTSKPP